MKVIIYGKSGCIDCDRSRMLCQIKSIDFQYHAVGSDISIDELRGKVGEATTSLPQIFIHRDDVTTYVGGYDELRSTLQRAAANADRARARRHLPR
ncbi:MAG: glutaredoxin [Steroidobacteraceae bacterium]